MTNQHADTNSPSKTDETRLELDAGHRELTTTGDPTGAPRGSTHGRPPIGRMDRFRLSQDFGAAVPVKKILTTVPVRKPHNQEFVRASENLIFRTLVFKANEDDALYLVEPELLDVFPGRLQPVELVGMMTRQGVFFFCPIFLQDGDEPWNTWHRSRFDAIVLARKDYVRIYSNRALGAYEVSVAQSKFPEPEWPDRAVEELIDIAFKDHIITNMDHPVVKMLQGRA